MKKLIVSAAAFITAAMLALPVFAGSDSLLRENKWGDSAENIKESGKFVGDSVETDEENRKWNVKSYETEIDGEKYTVKYDFTMDDKLFQVEYEGEKFNDEDKLKTSYKSVFDAIKAEYGEPDEIPNDDEYVSLACWFTPTGDISVMRIIGANVLVFYKDPDFDYNSLANVGSTSKTAESTSKTAQSAAVSATDDFLLRSNSWGMKAAQITENGKFVGNSVETDAGGHKWNAESYETEIGGEKFTVRYDFSTDGLFEVSYFGETITNADKLDASYKAFCDAVQAKYGKPEKSDDSEDFSSSNWSTPNGDIVVLKMGGYRTQAFYTKPNLNWDNVSSNDNLKKTDEEISHTDESAMTDGINPDTGNGTGGFIAAVLLAAACGAIYLKCRKK